MRSSRGSIRERPGRVKRLDKPTGRRVAYPDMETLLLAAVSEPAPAGRSSSLGIAIILLCLAALAAVGVLAALRGGRRGGGEPDPADPSGR